MYAIFADHFGPTENLHARRESEKIREYQAEIPGNPW